MIRIIPNWHPILVHFTVAMLAVATVLFVVRALAGRRRTLLSLETAANWNLWLGAAITLATVAAGLYAASTVAHDEPAHLAMESHEHWALVTATLFALLALWNAWRVRRGASVGWVFTVLLVVASAGLFGTGLRGADLVFGHGVGVAALPDVSAESRPHQHGGGTAVHESQPAGTASGPEVLSPADAEVIAALQAYHDALTSGTVEAVEGHVTADDSFEMIEGKHVNQGWTDYRDHHLAGELGDLAKVRFRLSVNQVRRDGSLAYVAFGYDVLPKSGPERSFGQGRATAVLIRADGAWKVRHLHTS